MARTPRNEGAASKKRGNKSASGRRGAPKRPQERAPTSAAKIAKAKAARNKRRPSGPDAASLASELKEARARQAATAEILKIVASSPSDVKPVFNAIVRTIVRVMRCDRVFFLRCEGGFYFPVATAALDGSFEVLSTSFPIDPALNFPSRAMVSKKTVYYPDRSLIELPEYELMVSRKYGANATLFLPLLRGDECAGVLALTSKRTHAFSASDIALAESFRDQALIAIENARLFNETKQALERQTATSDILKVIASSPSDVQPVFDAIAESARRVIGGHSSLVTRVVGDRIHLAAFTAGSEAGREKLTSTYPQPLPSSPVMSAEAVRTGQIVSYADTETGADDITRGFARARGYRSVISVPMLRDGIAIGTINVTRVEPGAFDENTIGLLKTFADQAVIAIENVRLFNETREALARQTATAEVLKVIASSQSNLQPVFDAIAERSNELMGGHSTSVFRFAGDTVELAAATSVGEEADALLRAAFPRPISAAQGVERILRGDIVETIDATADTEAETSRTIALARGFRSRLMVPLKGDDGTMGFISITRKESGAFAEKDVELLQTFADQAVIAIQNVELFEEVQARTRDLQESLQQQIATADALKVISRSAFDLDSVMNTLSNSARDLCGSEFASLFLREGDMLVCRGNAAVQKEHEDLIRANPVPFNDQSHMGRAMLTGTVANIGDFENDPNTNLRRFQQAMGFKSFLAVPLMREGRGIGVIVMGHSRLGEFTPRQVELVQTFADQAVIAIENTRLFNETTEALERQTATADILKVIASSPDDVQPVFQAIADQSKRLLDGLSVAVYSLADGIAHLMSFTPVSPTADADLKARFPFPLAEIMWGSAIQAGEIFRIIDTADESITSRMREIARIRGWRSAVFVPLLSDGRAIGAISVTRVEPGSFADHHVEILRTFADQAVIAISNVELFQEVQKRTRELSQSLDDLRAAQDRLVQTEKLASLGQLTAGIAHEIKNPLNFINNFSALSVELADELNDVLRKAELAEKLQQEANELTELLKSNLEKVVQHGKRADSIVKNMLLHSREGSGEQRASDINALVEESLNLAYHGARAEKSGFNITLQREFDAGAGSAELFPQEITRALLNLISNGFYAATRRKAESGDGAFEPTLLARTKNLGGSVEIRIRDNGIGIPREVKEKMFNPFFTTKPAGEGTGLGLSMTHDIIVKQHGGTIDVTTEPGHFTEFIVVLPRANGAQGKSRGQA